MNIAIFGLGLIGGSLGRAIIKKTSDNVVFGYDISADTIAKAKMLNAINFELNLNDIESIDLVLLCTTPDIAMGIMSDIVPKLNNNCIVIDTCGNKRVIVKEMNKLSKQYSDINFIGVHPMAGREFSGIAHSTAGLFENSYIIFTPVNATLNKISLVKKLFLSLGAENIVITTAENHDKIIAYTSQLAHIASSSYIKNPLALKHVGYSAGSFRDMTRVARLSSEMWTELFLQNKDNLLEQLDIFIDNLNDYREALKNNNSETLQKLLQDGSEMKEQTELLRRNALKK